MLLGILLLLAVATGSLAEYKDFLNMSDPTQPTDPTGSFMSYLLSL